MSLTMLTSEIESKLAIAMSIVILRGSTEEVLKFKSERERENCNGTVQIARNSRNKGKGAVSGGDVALKVGKQDEFKVCSSKYTEEPRGHGFDGSSETGFVERTREPEYDSKSRRAN
jgi:hypothetical protein